jgi:hypothetical protein
MMKKNNENNAMIPKTTPCSIPAVIMSLESVVLQCKIMTLNQTVSKEGRCYTVSQWSKP